MTPSCSLGQWASSEITVASIVYCVKTRCTCPASKNYCYPYELVAYSPEDVCDDVYDAGTGRIDADIVVDGNAFLSYFQFHDVKTITGSLRVVNNPQVWELRLDRLESVGGALYVSNNAATTSAVVSQCVVGAPVSYAVNASNRAQSLFTVSQLQFIDSQLMQAECVTPPAPRAAGAAIAHRRRARRRIIRESGRIQREHFDERNETRSSRYSPRDSTSPPARSRSRASQTVRRLADGAQPFRRRDCGLQGGGSRTASRR